jgi:hypothetical protein
MQTRTKEKLIAKQPINEESQPKLFLVTDVSGSSDSDVQLQFYEESPKAKKITPRKPTNNSVREREYLTKKEVYSLIEAAKKLGRYGKRDGLMIYNGLSPRFQSRRAYRPEVVASRFWQKESFKSIG